MYSKSSEIFILKAKYHPLKCTNIDRNHTKKTILTRGWLDLLLIPQCLNQRSHLLSLQTLCNASTDPQGGSQSLCHGKGDTGQVRGQELLYRRRGIPTGLKKIRQSDVVERLGMRVDLLGDGRHLLGSKRMQRKQSEKSDLENNENTAVDSSSRIARATV